MNQETTKIPGLGDIPILGALFRSEKWRRQETELVIIVTPYIVRPVDAKDIPLPTDGIKAPNDLDRALGGKKPNKTPRPNNKKDGRAGPVTLGRAGFKTGNF
jgi:pilus assembly protein CpaC